VDYEKDVTCYNKEKLMSGFGEFLCMQGYESYVCPGGRDNNATAFQNLAYGYW
jgi:hypothetical protein